MCMNCVPTLDTTSTEEFGEKLLGVMNHAGLALMLSIGHRTGLFDAMSELDAATSQQIADEAGLNERYVREWLGAMVTGRIVQYEPNGGTYTLPNEHAALLTRQAAPDNVAAGMQWFSVLGQVENDIVDRFRSGGGVHYSVYSRFHEVMAEESAQTVVSALTEHILPLVPDLMNRLEQGIDVLDVGCGAGLALNQLAQTFPNSRFLGFDFSDEAIAAARREAETRGVKNLRFEVRDVTNIGVRSAFDLITAFDAIHDQRDPERVLTEIQTALRADGVFLMQDIAASTHVQNNIGHPVGPFLYTISTMHCMTVSLALGGAGLGTCWGEELARQMLADAGFATVEVERLSHDIMNNYYIATRN